MSAPKPPEAFQGMERKKRIVEESGSSKFQKRPRVKDGRPRGIMIRLTPAQWIRVHEYVLNDNTNIQALGLYAISLVFKEKGLAEL